MKWNGATPYDNSDIREMREFAAMGWTAAMNSPGVRAAMRHARDVMNLLEEYGPSIVPHLLEDDESPGQFLREALAAYEAGLGED